LSTMMGHVVRRKRGCRGRGFSPAFLAAATAAIVAFALATPVQPAAAQGWNAGWPDYPVRSRPRHRLRAAPPAQPAAPQQVSKEPFGQIPKGPLQIIISIDQQKLHLYSDGAEVADTLIATGVPGHPTPIGVFSVIQKERLHHSNIYSGAPMPFMQRITWSGVALHEGGNLGHPASHGCVRLPHDFATRLWVLTRLGARVIIARPELRPTEFADPHLFVHREISPSVPTAVLQPPAEKPIKTAQSLGEDKTSDAAPASAEEPKEPARPASDTSATADKAESVPSAEPPVVLTAEATLRPSLSESPSAEDDESMPVVAPGAADALQPTPVAPPSGTVAAPTPAPAAPPSGTIAAPAPAPAAPPSGTIAAPTPTPAAPPSGTIAAPAPAPAAPQDSTAAAPQPAPAVLPVALPAVPVPPIKPAEIARSTPKAPIAIFISGREKKIYVRQDFSPLFSAPVTIAHPERPLGTHVFTALSLTDDHAHFRWNVVSLPSEPRADARTLANNQRIAIDPRYARGKREMTDAPEMLPPQTPQEALARIEIPQEIIDRISDLIIPGSSLIISDQGLGGETGEGTDFIITMR
jgi:lipoprotein-anchoring transpeptidase ErfK/SrfK